LGRAPGIVADIEEPTPDGVVVANEIQVRLIGAHHAVATKSKPAVVESNHAPEQAQRRAIARRKNDDVE
jgi:hypothetical protein